MNSWNLTCDRPYEAPASGRNGSGDGRGGNLLEMHSRFEGIPENVLLNCIACVVLVILFAILRKIAWDYGRIALIFRKEEGRKKEASDNERWTTLFYGNPEKRKGGRRHSIASMDSLDAHADEHDQGMNWFCACFRITDEIIAQKCGADTVQYLQFQQYLIVYLAIITVLSLAVIMPINFSGKREPPNQTYGHSTVSNMDTNSSVLWVHTLMALAYLILAAVFMRRFSAKLQVDVDEESCRTLMIAYIPKDKCFKNTIMEHFKGAYPNSEIEDVQFSFNIRWLAQLDERRKRAHEGKLNSEMLCNKTGTRPMMVPYYFGRLCCCCQRCGCRQVDAIDYYAAEESALDKQVEAEQINAFQDCTGIAFVTFSTEDMAHQVFYDYSSGVCKKKSPGESSSTVGLRANSWSVELAPEPNDIYWENLSLNPFWWWLKAILINGVLVIVLFFLTTPAVLVHGKKNGRESSGKSAVASQFFATLFLWFCSIMLPWVTFYSDQFIGHWTRTKEHHTVMRKTFIFLLLMILILPSLGLPSAKAFLEYAFGTGDGKQIRWSCIFVPGNGAFFVNYVITSAFIGNALTLMRFPELSMFVSRMIAARSAYEQSAVRRAVLWEFQFGQEYAWMLCIFTVVMAYSILSPLVTPFGLFYMIGRYYVDRYNLFFAYKPSKINHHVHESAINYVIIALIILQFNMLFYNTLQTTFRHGLPAFSGVVVFLALLVFCGWLFFGWFKNWVPIKYMQFENKEENRQNVPSSIHHDDKWQSFMPEVLQHARQDSHKQNSDQFTYGTIASGTGQVLAAEVFDDPEYIDTTIKSAAEESSEEEYTSDARSRKQGYDSDTYSDRSGQQGSYSDSRSGRQGYESGSRCDGSVRQDYDSDL